MSSVEEYIFEQERKIKKDEEKVNNEKYYWIDSKGNKIPKHEINNYYLCNIVMKFGKNWLLERKVLLTKLLPYKHRWCNR